MSWTKRCLADQQCWFIERVTEPGDAHARAADVEERVVAGSLGARARLNVYRHGYTARLLECLEDDYPALQHALGREPFAELCRDFVRQHPPRGPSLNYYGAPLPGYCARRRERWAAFAAELAALEWALVEAIHESDEQQLGGAALAQIPEQEWACVRLWPSPTLRLLDTRYPVGRYYQSFREGELLTERFPAAERSGLAVCRRGAEVWRVRIEPELLPLLASLIAGTPLLAALQVAAAEGQGPGAEALQRAFRDWVACGMFAAASLPGASRPDTALQTGGETAAVSQTGSPAQSPPPPQLEPHDEPLLQLEPQEEPELSEEALSDEKELHDDVAGSDGDQEEPE